MSSPLEASGSPVGSPASPVPQRALLVVGSSGRFDARAHRIATTLAARGHEVVVLGRSGPDVPDEERLSDGTRVLRVHVSAVDGLPLPGPIRAALARRWERRRPGDAPGQAARTAERRIGVKPPPAVRIRRAAAGLVRIAAVVLSVRSQVRGARRIVVGSNLRSDVVIGLGFMGLPVALGVAASIPDPRGGFPARPGAPATPPVVYDASDIYADAGNIARLPAPIRAAFSWLERRWARRAARVATANDGYADVIAGRFGVERPLVLLNCPPFAPPSGADHPLRDALGSDAARPIVLYHGGISPDRGIEQLIDASALLGDLPGPPLLVVMGYGSLEAALRSRIAAEHLESRVRLLPPVPQDVLLGWIADADVAAMPIQPTTLNHRLTVPNKLLEAMAAGTPILASDLPGMAPIVRSSGCGLLVDPTSPAAIADAVRRILTAPAEEREAWREAGRRAARERYSWEHEAPKLLDALSVLTGRAW